MKITSVILAILSWLLVGLVWNANGQTMPPPPPTSTNRVLIVGEPYSVTDGVTNAVKQYPFLLVTGVDTNGPIYEAPPEWMLEKRDPRYVVKAMTELGGETVEIEIRISGDQGFYQAGMEVGMGTEVNLGQLSNKFIKVEPFVLQGNETEDPEVILPETVLLNGVPYTRTYDGYYHVSVSSVCYWNGNESADNYIYRFSTTGEWYIAPKSTYAQTRHPDTGTDLVPKDGWTDALGNPKPDIVISY